MYKFLIRKSATSEEDKPHREKDDEPNTNMSVPSAQQDAPQQPSTSRSPRNIGTATDTNSETQYESVISMSARSLSSCDEDPKQKKKKAYIQRFKHEWKLKFVWLDINTQGQSYCKVCHNILKGGVTHLERHNRSFGHKKNVEMSKKTVKIKEPDKKKENLVKKAELKLIGFLHEHNLPFLLMDHLILLLVSIFPDSEIVKDLKCGRTKATKLTKDCLAEEQLSIISTTLQMQPFSLIIDETTDISTQKSLVLVARYFDDMKKRCRDIFIGLIRVRDCTSKSLFDSICTYLQKLNIPLNNLMGLAADNASVMMGNIGGVKALFKNILPNIFVLGCVCHSFHLCSSAAAKKLPRSLEEFIRSVYNYFSHSSKRKETFETFQKFSNIKLHKMLHPSQTRWLSLQAAVDRVLENWEPLTLFFRMEVFEEDLNSTRGILASFEHPTYKLYFTFLSYILDIINKLNLEFQSEKPKIFNVMTHVSDLYRTILRNYLRKDYIDNIGLNDIDFKGPRNFLPIEKLYLGAKTEVLMSNGNIDKTELSNFRLRCLDFYIELVNQIKKDLVFLTQYLTF